MIFLHPGNPSNPISIKKIIFRFVDQVMSGGIFFRPADGAGLSEDVDKMSENPLFCFLCKELFEDPCLLQCYHTFCSRCLQGRAVEAKMICPLCGKSTPLKDDASLPSRDPLLNFLIESSVEEWPPCSNCDKLIRPAQDPGSAMFFCNTCSQALCGPCREETHRAKMFSKHDVVHMSKRTKEIYKTCKMHSEPYIMFSTLQKTMLCINCFRDMNVDGRAHCIDLDSAYNQGCNKLDGAVLSIREMQHSVRDGIILYRALLEDLRRNMEIEKESINQLCQMLQDTIISTRNSLIEDVQRQYDVKNRLFHSQLASLGTLLPTIQVHLIMCTTFSNSANKHEFLHLGYMLMERLSAIGHMTSPLRPNQNSQINTNYKLEFSRNLDPIIGDHSVQEMGVETNTPFYSSSDNGLSPGQKSPFCEVILQPSTQTSTTSTLPTRRLSYNVLKLKSVELSGPFTDHYKNFDSEYKELLIRFTKAKDQVQEMQRDITLRKCLTKKGKVTDITNECTKMDSDIKHQFERLENMKTTFEKLWDEQLQRIRLEQEVYNGQINNLLTMTLENQHLSTVVRQLEPFIKAITTVVEKLSPRLRTSLNEEGRDDCMQALLEQINTIQPDSRQRVDAIQSQEELWHNKMTAGPSAFEESLIQTKGMLRTPMKDGIPIKKDVDGTPLKDESLPGLVMGRVMECPTACEITVAPDLSQDLDTPQMKSPKDATTCSKGVKDICDRQNGKQNYVRGKSSTRKKRK